MDAIAEAKDWLNNTSDYNKGLEVLNFLGCDAFTFALLSSGADNFNREKLYSEISSKITSEPLEKPIIHLENLNDCVGKTNILNTVSDKTLEDIKTQQMVLMDERSELKAKLRFLSADKTKQPERKKIAFEILDITDKLNQLEEDKTFFLQFGYLPSGLPEPEDNPIDLLKRQGTLRTYIVRYSKPGSNPDKLKEYQEELAIVDAKLKKYAV